MTSVSSKDEKLVAQVQAECGSSGLAAIVGMRLEDKQREIDALRAQVEGLRSAIYGVRQFAPVSRMSEAQKQGYSEASLDLLMLAGLYLSEDNNPNEIPPLGWGRG